MGSHQPDARRLKRTRGFESAENPHMDISAILCTHNPDLPRLKRALSALEGQTLSKDRWEFICVDNASSQELAGRVDLGWHSAGRIVREETVGLTHARLKGIAEARGDVLVFVDDDSLLDADYLARALEIFREHPFMGAVGGYGRAEYETTPPEWLTKSLRQYHLDIPPPPSGHKLMYARVQRHWGPWFPVGAGMAIRREIALRYVESIRGDPVALGFGRSGNALSGGEELDMAICAMDQGYAIGRSGDLRFTHIVPGFRLELNYMLRLLYMSQYSTERLMVHRGWKKPLPLEKPTWRRKVKRWFARARRHSPEDLCWRALSRGRADGLSGAPPDPFYSRR